MLCFESSEVEVVTAQQPHIPERLQPCRREHPNVFPAFCDIAILGAFGAADDEVGYV